MLIAGGLAIVAGGIVAAVTGPSGWTHGSWVAAFLVLVAGVAQVGVAAGQAHLATTPPSTRFTVVEVAGWNVSCLFVVTGTLASSPVTVSIGSALLAAVLGMSAFAVRGSVRQPRGLLIVYRMLLTVLLMSTPVGVALSWMRH